MAQLPLLIADGDWIRIVIPLVFFAIYTLNKLLSNAKQPAGQARKTPRRPDVERSFQPPQPEARGKSATQLNDEIEKFLKRAKGRSEKPQRQRMVSPPPPAPPRQLVERPVDAEIVERRDFDSVAASVEKHLADRGFSKRTEHLADDIVRADQQMESHLQKAFSHQVGRLTSPGEKATEAPVTDTVTAVVNDPQSAAAALGALLANPQNIRSAVILKEILDRPEHRW